MEGALPVSYRRNFGSEILVNNYFCAFSAISGELEFVFGAELYACSSASGAVLVFALAPKDLTANVHLLDRAPDQVPRQVERAAQSAPGLDALVVNIQPSKYRIRAKTLYPPVLEGAEPREHRQQLQIPAVENAVIDTILIHVAPNAPAVDDLKLEVIFFVQYRQVDRTRQGRPPAELALDISAGGLPAIQHLTTGKVTEALDLKSDIAVAYAVTYVFGTAGLIILLKIIANLWKINLPESAKKAEAELGSVDEQESVEAFHWSNLVVPRAYRVDNKGVIGKTVQELEALFPKRVAVDRIKKGDQVIDQFNGDIRLDKGDIVVLTGFRSRVLKASEIIGPEVDDKVVQEMVGEILGICMTNKALDGKSINEIFMGQGHGCFIRNVTRQGHELPLAPKLRVHRGDIISVIGAHKDVEALIAVIGYTVPYAIGNVLLTVWGALIVSMV